MFDFIQGFFRSPTNEDIQEAFEQFFPNLEKLDTPLPTETIQSILQKENRHLWNVFSLDRDDDVGKTIFKAIFASMYFEEFNLSFS